MNQRIAVVGGAGFVGQSLSLALANKGFQLLIIDSARCPEKLQNLAGATFKDINITDVVHMRSALADFSPSTVVHLASM